MRPPGKGGWHAVRGFWICRDNTFASKWNAHRGFAACVAVSSLPHLCAGRLNSGRIWLESEVDDQASPVMGIAYPAARVASCSRYAGMGVDSATGPFVITTRKPTDPVVGRRTASNGGRVSRSGSASLKALS